MHTRAYLRHGAHAKVRGQFQGSAISVLRVDPEEKTQVFMFGRRCLYPLSHLTSSGFYLLLVLLNFYFSKDVESIKRTD